MAVFLKTYLHIPGSDRKKTTLRLGNPHRRDHTIIGASVCRGSLYKPPKTPNFQTYWIWDDPDFDFYDPQPSEFLVTKQIFDEINREVERVQQDPQVSFRHHYLVGGNLTTQLGFLHQRALDLNVHRPENIYYVFLGGKLIDLEIIATGKKSSSKTLKPQYLRSEVLRTNTGSQSTLDQVMEWYENYEFTNIEQSGIKDIQSLLNFYHYLRQQ